MAVRWFRPLLCLLFWSIPPKFAARSIANVVRAPSYSSAAPLASYMKDAGDIKGVHVLYSFPGSFYPPHYAQPADSPVGDRLASSPTKGTFVMLHACGHFAQDFYQLPEEVEMTIAVLQRGYAVFAPDAYPMPGGCWGPAHDGILVRDALQTWLDQHGLANKPLYGLGVSNGGVMLSYLFSVMDIKFQGMHFNVSPGGATSNDAGTFAAQPHPPVAFVRMLADPYAPADIIDAAVTALRHAGSPVKVFESPPKPLGYLYTRAEKIPMSRHTMSAIIERIDAWGFAVEYDGPKYPRMKQLPPLHRKYIDFGTGEAVMKGLEAETALADILPNHRRALYEEIMVIEGYHAPTSQHVGESLDFILAHRNQQGTRSLLRHHSRILLRHHGDM